jgi:hypothetical protein
MKPLSVEEERTSPEFFNESNFVLQFCPTHPSEIALMERFAKLNIGGGKKFDVQSLPSEVQKAIKDGMAGAWNAYDETQKKMTTGDQTSADLLGSRDYLKDNYLYRMMGTVDGILGNAKEEAIYPGYYIDATGQPLNGAIAMCCDLLREICRRLTRLVAHDVRGSIALARCEPLKTLSH